MKQSRLPYLVYIFGQVVSIFLSSFFIAAFIFWVSLNLFDNSGTAFCKRLTAIPEMDEYRERPKHRKLW